MSSIDFRDFLWTGYRVSAVQGYTVIHDTSPLGPHQHEVLADGKLGPARRVMAMAKVAAG